MLSQKQFAFGTLVAGLLMFAVATTAMALVETINYKGGHESFDKALIANGREYKCQVTGAPGGTKFEWDPPGTGIVSGGGGDSDSSLTWKSDMSSRSESIGVDIYPPGDGSGGSPYHASWDAVLKDPVLSVYNWTAGGPWGPGFICAVTGGSQQVAAEITLSGSIDIAGSINWTINGDVGSVAPAGPEYFTTSTGDSPKITTYTVQAGSQKDVVTVKGTIKNELGAGIKSRSSDIIEVGYTELETWSEVVACSDLEQHPTKDKVIDGCSTPTGNDPTGCETGDTSFYECCATHDTHYQTCEYSKYNADMEFGTCMHTVCWDLPGGEEHECFSGCQGWAYAYAIAVDLVGTEAYRGDQVQYCVCCEPE